MLYFRIIFFLLSVSAFGQNYYYTSGGAVSGGGEEPGEDTSLVARYPLQTDANDVSGNGYNLTLYGSPSYAEAGGRTGIQLNGTSQYGTASGSVMDGLTEFTITFWARLSANGDYPVITTNTAAYGAGSEWTPEAVSIRFDISGYGNGPNQFKYAIQGMPELNTPNNSYSLNTWVHFAITFKKDVARTVYVNGSSVLQTISGGSESLDKTVSSNVFAIGRGTKLGYFNGYVSDVRVYNQAKTAGEILTIYNE